MTSQAGEDQHKIHFFGTVRSVQVRSTVWRYITHNRTHREIGYNIFMTGTVYGDDAVEPASEHNFSIAITESQMNRLQLIIGDVIEGTAWTKMYPKQEYADYYRAGALKRMEKRPLLQTSGPPWLSEVPDLKTYTWRGARQLDSRCYKGKCFQCKWAAMANVSIEYNWDTGLQKHRFESFCYGPKSCSFYRMGPPRAVPCKGMDTAYDDECLDEICTENREYDD